jgi:cytochrome P450
MRIPKGVSGHTCRLVDFRTLTSIKTIVGTQNYTIQRDTDAFRDPESFYPDRWLEAKNEDAVKEAFVPFSVGSRSCIGIK